MISRMALSLLVLAAGAPALAQTADEPPTPRERPEITAPAGEAPKAIAPIDRLAGPRDWPDDDVAATEQVFISPSGEPFRAAFGQPYPVANWFGRADTDRDGALTAEEFAADHIVFFDRLDADKDEVVDGFESDEYERVIAPEVVMNPGTGRRRSRGFLFGRRRTLDLKGAAPYALLDEPLPVRTPDANFDYRVTREELLAAAQRRFGILDADKDGRITMAELPITRAQALAARRRVND